jgi:hypothetical protein
MNSEFKTMLGISWWNTSLSPVGKCRASAKDKKIATEIIRLIIHDLGIDCFAFGEVTTEDLHYIAESDSLRNYQIFDGTLKEGRLLFDTGLIYNKLRLRILDACHIISSYGRQTLKIAQRIDFIISETHELLHIYILHWPSRLWCTENSAKRDTLGIRLRDAIDDLKSNYPSSYPPQIIILGDFNDEPFNDSLAGHLLATRDRTVVKQNDLYFYNPFWRHLGESLPHSHGLHSDSICGTCYHRTGEETRWRTFDQIIVSSSFLRDDRWYIEEKYTKILHHPLFNDLLLTKSRIFDHHPVLSYIRRSLNDFNKEVTHD